MALGSVGSMVVSVLADTKDFDKKMGTSTKKVDKFQAKVQKMGKAITKAAKLAAAAAAAAVVAFGVSAVKTFVEFDTGMREVFTLMPDLSAEARDAMEEDIQALSEEIGVISTEIIPALYQAISAGVPRENVFEYMRVAGEAAVGGNIELKDSVVGLAQVMNAYGAEVDTVREYSDIMFSIVKDGITTMGELSSELFKVAPVAADLGIQFSSIAGWMAELTAQGVPTAEAASYMKVALNELSKAGTVASDTFEKAAGITFPKFIEAGGTLVEAFEIIDDYAIDADMSVKDMFGSIEAGGAVLMATGVHFDSFSGKVANAEEAAGNTQAAYAEMAAGIKHELDKIAAWWERLQTVIGKDLTKSLQALLSWLESNQEAIGKSITAIFDGLITSLEWLQKNAGAVKVALVTLSIGVTTLWASVHPVAAAIVAIVAALTYFNSTGGTAGLYDAFQDAAQTLNDFITEEKEMIVVTEAVANALSTSMQDATLAIQQHIVTAAKSAGDYQLMMRGLANAQVKAMADLQKGLRFDIVLKNFSTMASDILKQYGVLDEDIAEVLATILGESADMWSEATGVAIDSTQEMAVQVRVSSELMSSNLLAVINSLAMVGDTSEDTADKVATGLIRLTDEQLAFYKEALARAAAAAIVAADLAADIAETNAEIAADYASMWESVRTEAETALSDIIDDFINFSDTREEEEETHQANLQAIRDEYAGQSQAALDIALAGEEQSYKDSRTTIGGTLRDMFGDFVGYLADELWALSKAEAAKSLIALILGDKAGFASHGEAAYEYGLAAGAVRILQSSIPGYAEGGIVPGPIGAPQMAIVHGGEEVLTPEDRMAGGIDYERLGEAVAAGFLDARDEMGGGQPIIVQLADGTTIAQALYNPLQQEDERRGGAA